MSIDLNWETLTAGPDGQELAHRIRDFIHTKFQSVPLPRFIKSVTVHDFEFGSIPPEVELKDITDPLPDFYEENSDLDDDDEGEDEYEDEDDDDSLRQEEDIPHELRAAAERRRRRAAGEPHLPPPPHIRTTTGGGGGGGAGPPPPPPFATTDLGSPFLGASTPGFFPGGASALHYFHSQFATGRSGSQTPLAAVAGAHHLAAAAAGGGGGHSSSSPDLRRRYAADAEADEGGGGGGGRGYGHGRNVSQSSNSVTDFGTSPPGPSWGGGSSHGPGAAAAAGGFGRAGLREKHSVSTLAPTSAGGTRPPTRDAGAGALAIDEDEDEGGGFGSGGGGGRRRVGVEGGRAAAREAREEGERSGRRFAEPRVEDMQAVFRIRYAGDVKLLLTADILLDYPMPSFVGIPVKLSVTGLTFDGVGVVAYIRKRVHFCFLSPEDAMVAVGAEDGDGEGGGEGVGGLGAGGAKAAKMGGLLHEVRVESEIGQREGGKQSLKNVGKVERFVLEQVRRIFEEEFVYPSFWTFLV